jgi:hypothetical protein
MHHLKLFIEDGVIVYVHHDEDHPANDEPGKHLKLKPGKKLKFKSRDGDLTITFKGVSPFVSGDTVVTATVGKFSKTEEIKPFTPPPRNPPFAYRAQIGAISEDPEIIIDTDGGGGATTKKKAKAKAVKKKKK